MAEIVNDRDLLIMAAVPRFTPPTDRGMFLTPSAAIFRASGNGSTSTPPSFTFKATLLNMAGQVSFGASNGAKLTVNAATNEATLDFAAYTAAGAEAIYITAAITVDGVPYAQQAIVTKVSDGAQGADGAQTAVARLYQFSTTVPAKPTGGSTFTWAGAWNGTYAGTDGWSVTVPANPGTPGLRLYVASVSVSAAGKATTTAVSYTGATVEAWSQNGATGASGVQSGAATVYQWAATIPAGPVGSALFRWASNSFGEAPSGWTLVPGAAPAAGMTLWAASVKLVDSAANGDTSFNWSSASIMAIGYAGTNGGPGQQGASYVTAYIASSAIAANGAPAQTTGRTSLPAANSSGLAGTYSTAVPTLADGQRMYQTDGIYDPATDKVTWSIPYWSSLKVATLSAITANLGAINAGSINLGGGTFTVDNDGNLVCRSIKILNPDGSVMLQAGGKLNPANAAPGTVNSDIVIGGRNLAQDSAFERRLRPWAQKSPDVAGLVIEGVSGNFNLLFDTAGGDAYVDGQGPLIPVTPGKQYVFSYEYATNTLSSITSSSNYFYDNLGGAWGFPMDVLQTGGARLRQITVWVCPANVTGVSPRFGIRSTGYSWMRVYNFQVEEGNKPTTWMPAKEDIDAGILTAGKTAIWDSVNGRPEESANLIKKGSFEDGLFGTWSNGYIQAVDNAQSGLVPYTKSFITNARDSYETGNNIRVTPGETIYGSAWLGTQDCQYSAGFGFIIYDKNGAIITWMPLCPIGGYQPWSFIQGSYTFPASMMSLDGVVRVPAQIAPWLQQNGPANAPQYLRSAGLWLARHARGATVGAPAGTLVNGVTVESLTAQAAAGNNAASQIPGLNTAIGKKLQADSYAAITGQFSLQSSSAILVGTTNDGIIIGNGGLYGRKGGYTTFGIGADGTATFAGSLLAPSGTLGSLTIVTGGSIKSGSYTGYAWPASGGTGFYFGPEGVLIGNFNNNRYFQATGDGNVFMPGFRMENGQLTLTNPVIIAPKLQTTLSVSLPNTALRNISGSSVTFGVTPVISGGVGGPYRYLWAFSPENGPSEMAMTGDPTGSSAVLKATGSGWKYGYLSLTVYDSGGAVAGTSTRISVQFGNAVEP